MLATYFGGARRQSRHRAGAARRRACISISCARPEQLDDARASLPKDRVLSLGVIDGRNIWRADLSRDPRPARTRRRQTGQRPRADRAVLLAAACPDRSGAGDQPRSRREELAGLLGAEDRANWRRSARRWRSGRGHAGDDPGGLRCRRPQRARPRPAFTTPEVASAPRRHRRRRCASRASAVQRPRRRAARGASTCRPSRPRPSARSRRPPMCATPAPRTPRAR